MTWADRVAERMKAATLARWEDRQLAAWHAQAQAAPPGWGAPDTWQLADTDLLALNA